MGEANDIIKSLASFLIHSVIYVPSLYLFQHFALFLVISGPVSKKGEQDKVSGK